MLIADIDHFKRINDEFGHGTGDQALVAVAQVLDSMQGAHQRHASRWGGEEFLLLLPGQRLAEACRSAEELRRRIAELQLPVGGLRLTVQHRRGRIPAGRAAGGLPAPLRRRAVPCQGRRPQCGRGGARRPVRRHFLSRVSAGRHGAVAASVAASMGKVSTLSRMRTVRRPRRGNSAISTGGLAAREVDEFGLEGLRRWCATEGVGKAMSPGPTS